MSTYFDLIILALPRLWTKDLRFGGGWKQMTRLQAEMSIPSSQTLVHTMTFFLADARSFSVSFCSLTRED